MAPVEERLSGEVRGKKKGLFMRTFPKKSLREKSHSLGRWEKGPSWGKRNDNR